MARKTNEATALAPVNDTTNELAVLDDFDFGTDDGLQEVDASDFKLPVVVWNMKGRKADGSLHQLDQFYDTLNEKSFGKLRCAFIHLHKTNAFARFDQVKNETEIVCSSYDRQRGMLRVLHNGMAIGTQRPCEGCPDSQWARDATTGKNTRNCAEVYGVFAALLDEHMRPTDGFLIRFKKTGLAPFKTHLQKHHLGRRTLPNGKRGNVPLFAFAVELSLEVDKSGNFAVPVISRGDILPKQTIEALAEQAKFFAELGDEATKAAEKQEAKFEHVVDAPAGGGGGFRADDFTDG